MRAHSSPLMISEVGSDGQSCLALEAMPLAAGSVEGRQDEGWLQKLIQDCPALLPVADIEPGLMSLVPVCMELSVPSGYVDNLMVTPEGGIVVVETKLWRNPQARREVVGQVLDYAKDLSALTYEALERTAGAARKEHGFRLIDLVLATGADVDEAQFIDRVTRNLKLGRFLLIIAGDGIQEGAEQLAGFVQRHVGLHFTLALVEMSIWRIPEGGRIVVLPRIIARTVEIERAVVRVEAGVSVVPLEASPTTIVQARAPSLSEAQFYESLGIADPALPARLKAFIDSVSDLGVFADLRRNLSLKWRGADGQDYHLGSVAPDGTVGTDYCNWSTNAIGRLDLAHSYLEDLARLIPGGKIHRTKSPVGWRVVDGKGNAPLAELLNHRDEWTAAIARFIDALTSELGS